MPEIGAIILITQAIAAPSELLNLALNAQAVAPEGVVLLAMLGTLMVDLAGEKAAARWAPPHLLCRPRDSPCNSGHAMEWTT